MYLNGFYPVHAHGSEFKFIADNVGVRSNGRFSIQRLATAEEMANRVLDKDIAHRNKDAMDRRNENSMLIFVFKNDGVVNMTRISVNNKSALNTILNYYSKPQNMKLVDKIIASTDQRLIKLVNDLGFRTIMRNPKFWNVYGTGFADHVRNGAYECDVLLSESTHIGRIIESVINDYIYQNKAHKEHKPTGLC